MPNNRPDFVNIQLAAAGVKAAAGSNLQVSRGKQPYVFSAGVPVEVERSFEWNVWLANMHTPQGEPLFELAPEPSANQPAASAAATSSQEKP